MRLLRGSAEARSLSFPEWTPRDLPNGQRGWFPRHAEAPAPLCHCFAPSQLISAEGHEFVVEKQAAMVSNTIKSMLTGPGAFHPAVHTVALPSRPPTRRVRRPSVPASSCTLGSAPALPHRRLSCSGGAGVFAENDSGAVTFPDISTPVLEEVRLYRAAPFRDSLPSHDARTLWQRPCARSAPRHWPCIACRGYRQVIKYFYYKLRYSNEPMPPEFVIDPSIALELLMAANYLDT